MEQNHKTEPKTCALQKKHCGGCPLLSQPYAAQLAAKQARLEKLLGRFARVRPILGMQEPWHYRNKVISTFAASSIICAFGLASAAPRSPYRHLELCGIALTSPS